MTNVKTPLFQVVLVEPEIPWNTGNVGRTCLGVNAALTLVGKLGFSLEDKFLKRAGLDYWPRVPLKVAPDREAYFQNFDARRAFFFSAKAKKSFWKEKVPKHPVFVFGCETKGLPESLKRRYAAQLFRLPVPGSVRSLNLSTAVGMVLGEALRQHLSKE
jgi:tRNA (cytidine/uridine-2'-O-)-methyltransferase